MATAPQIALRDGSGFTQNLVLTTNLEFISITGKVDINTVDIQVSIGGAPFVSDPSLVSLVGQTFFVPNPSSFPDGIALELGVNTIALRAIDIIGGVSSASTVTITRVASIAGIDQLIPTGIRVHRKRDSIDLLAVVPTPDFLAQAAVSSVSSGTIQSFEFRGFNFYASSAAAGTTGYFKVNSSPVTTQSATFEEDLTEIASYNVVFDSQDNVRVRITQEDAAGEETGLVLDTVVNSISVDGTVKFTGLLQSRALSQFIVFNHVRGTGPNADQFIDIDSAAPLYYVVTGVFFDSTLNEEFETPYSQEVLGTPFVIDTSIRDLPGRQQLQIILDFVGAVQRADSLISLIPGSTPRDITIDPFSSEAERLWFIVDFVHKSSSFLTLLQIDDTNNDGVSDPVASSSYKQALRAALGLQTDDAVQQLIDAQFDKLANNFQKPRLPGRPAVGQVVFFTATRPSQDVSIASGTIVSTDSDPSNGLPSVRYVVGGTFVLPAAQADAFYNFTTRRYEITADVVAESIGSDGNRAAGDIKNVLSSVGGMQVTNTESTVFGDDRESNADLATRAMLGFVSVDTGTEGGYTSTSAAQIGIVKNKIVKSGDPLMMRDYDEVRHKHIGGKVDVWVQGLRERTVTERFAFSFDVARDIRCDIIDLANLIFRVLDSRVTPNSPVVEILNNLPQGLGVRNVTKGQNYDLSGVAILDYQTFQLNASIPQPVTAIDDIVTADYRFRAVNQFKFTLQPVRRITSVVGEASGALDITRGFSLFKVEDPLLNGESTIAKDYMVINQIGGVPSGATIAVNDEQHVMIGFFDESLGSIGINTATIRVFNQIRTIEYAGPGSASPDFDIVKGTATTPVQIVRTNPSTIVSGQTVSVDYVHDENFTVTYVINDLLQQLQKTINSRRHITGDVLVKQAILNSVALETTVQLKPGATKDKTDPAIRTSTSIELNQKLIGQGTAQSDIINAVDSTAGVDFQVVPLAKMGYADGSKKLREGVLSSAQRVPSLDIGGNQVFILTNALQFPTTDGGGLATEHRGVFQDDEAMGLASTVDLVGQAHKQAYILGSGGSIITGYSDDATLLAAGFLTASAIAAERLRLTANHVLVSLSGAGLPPDNPALHVYAVSYVVRGDVGPHDISTSQVEALDLGDFTLTIRSSTTPGP
jgi:hypothetical protein